MAAPWVPVCPEREALLCMSSGPLLSSDSEESQSHDVLGGDLLILMSVNAL